jgi:hypothetical protein
MTNKISEEKVRKLEDELREIKSELKGEKFRSLEIGDTFELAGLTWKMLDRTDKGIVCLAERIKDSFDFGTNNDWKESSIRKYLNKEFYEKLVDEIGEDHVVTFERVLTSLDGQKEYGSCEDKVSIISLDEYRKYRELIPNEKYWWWTLTPDSTKCNNDTSWVCIVSPGGYFNFSNCSRSYGVRPFCILKSNIFVSKVEED